MPTNRDYAETIIQTYVDHRRNGGSVFVTYGQLAAAIGRSGEHRLLGGPLDLVRDLCAARGLPDIATVVVSKSSLADSTYLPSKTAIDKHGGWPGLKAEQARVSGWPW